MVHDISASCAQLVSYFTLLKIETFLVAGQKLLTGKLEKILVKREGRCQMFHC